MKYTIDDIKVHILDWKKINADLTESVLKNGIRSADGGVKTYPKDMTFEIRHKVGMVEEPRFALLDDECVGFVVTKDSKDEWEFPVFRGDKEIVDHGKKRWKCAMFPSFNVKFSSKEIAQYRTGETKTLKEFMGRRFGYNSRVQSNTQTFLDYFNGKED